MLCEVKSSQLYVSCWQLTLVGFSVETRTMTGTLTANWKKVADDDVLKRSSHAVAAIDGQLYVFGGELVARQPRDGDVHAVALDGGIPKSSL